MITPLFFRCVYFSSNDYSTIDQFDMGHLLNFLDQLEDDANFLHYDFFVKSIELFYRKSTDAGLFIKAVPRKLWYKIAADPERIYDIFR